MVSREKVELSDFNMVMIDPNMADLRGDFNQLIIKQIYLLL